MRVEEVVTLNIQNNTLTNELSQGPWLHLVWRKGIDVLLQVLNDGILLVSRECVLSPVIGEKLNQALFHQSSMLLVIVHFEFVDYLILDNLFNDVFKGYNTNNLMRRVPSIPYLNLCNDSYVCQTFFEVP